MPSIRPESLPHQEKYNKLLNNLLGIKQFTKEEDAKDAAVFTKVENNNYFDVLTKFGQLAVAAILENYDLDLELEEKDLNHLIEVISKANDASAIVSASNAHFEPLNKSTVSLLNHPDMFTEAKKTLLHDLQVKSQASKLRWERINKNAIYALHDENVWPLHLATLFVAVRTGKQIVYGPLLLRKVKVQWASQTQLNLRAMGSWKLNEKLLFLLSDYGFFKHSFILENLTLKDCINVVSKAFGLKETSEIVNWQFQNLRFRQVTNLLQIYPGVVLGNFRPSGSYLRKFMQQIIAKGELESILATNADKSLYRQNVVDSLANSEFKIVQVQPSNYSQDQAMASALIQDTIIWGPPGTGKSQVIANIMANVLFREQSAIVVSQKSAALEVLKARLGELAPFVFFAFTNEFSFDKNSAIQKDFYENLQQFVLRVESASEETAIVSKAFVSEHERKALSTIEQVKNNNTYHHSLKVINLFAKHHDLLPIFYSLDPKWSYPHVKLELAAYIDHFAQANGAIKKGFFTRRYALDFLTNAQAAHKILSLSNIEIESNKELLQKTDLTEVQKLLEAAQHISRTKTFVSEEALLAKHLAWMALQKIKHWESQDQVKYARYKEFASAVRAGKSYPFRFIERHISIIRELFAIIATTPETTFIEWKKASFDYAIVDESSQLFLEVGLPILYLAKIKILAGDQQQLQPSRWNMIRDEKTTEDFVDTDADSLLDYAFNQGIYQVLLDQNYRSTSASLMAFSSRYFYGSKLEVTDDSRRKNKAPIEVFDVAGKWEENTNLIEANKVIEIAKTVINSYGSIIILTFNRAQRVLVEKLLQDDENATLNRAMQLGQLMLSNIENIQGTEADLVIVSVCYDPSTVTDLTYVSRPGGQNALNVALSRAKMKMIVVKSITASNVRIAKTRDFEVFREWLRFLELTDKEQKQFAVSKHQLVEAEGLVESSFEATVVNELVANISTERKLRLEKQWPVGSKRIDLAIIDVATEKFILGIEVDGHKYHHGYESYLADKSRIASLEAKGYSMFRISEIDWQVSQDQIIERINKLIEVFIDSEFTLNI